MSDKVSVSSEIGANGHCYVVEVYLDGHFAYVSSDIETHAEALKLARRKGREYKLEVWDVYGTIYKPDGRKLVPNNI